MGSHTTKIQRAFRPTVPFVAKILGEPMLVDVRVILLVEDDMTDKHLHPYIESRTLRVYMYVYYRQVNKEMDFHTTKIDEPFSVRFHF
jgi:hypothetical protein